jgi:uncharacterized membrane protein
VRVLALVAALLALGTLVGMVVLWPRGDPPEGPQTRGQLGTLAAEVVAVTEALCPGSTTETCRRARIRVDEGPRAGTEAEITAPEGVSLDPGDGIRVFGTVVRDPSGQELTEYSLSDFERRLPLLLLAVAFAAVVLLTARWKGLRALAGVAGSLAVVILFIVPAMLDGAPALAVALVGALAIMFVTIPLAHGVGTTTLAATIGTAASLLITLGLAAAFIELAHLTGYSSDDAPYLAAIAPGVSISGLVLAGMVIGALGVLDDLTVSQASTVVALRRTDPALGAAGLMRRGLEVGRDHATATVNTLVLAYVGAALPTLLIFGIAETSLGDAVNGEVVAVEVVAMLVGSMGLMAAVPITTGIAALVAVRLDPGADYGGGHSHAH